MAQRPNRESPAPLRRRPSQARAVDRIERVLDAAAMVFSEVGYEPATTTAIAARADTSVGALYEFFPNKQALAEALAARYVRELGSFYGAIAVDDATTPGEVIIDRIVTALGRFYGAHPGVAPLLRGIGGSPELTAAAEHLREAFMERMFLLLRARRPRASEPRLRLVASVLVDITQALLDRAQRERGALRREVLEETKGALLSYVRAALPAESAEGEVA